MNARTAPVAISLALALALAAGACGTSISEEVARDRQIDKDMAAIVAAGVPGASLVVRDGGSTNKVAVGVAETSTKVALKVDDRFRIGSLAKTYVSVVMLQLVNEKKLGLDDSIEKFVPEWWPTAPRSPCASCSTTRAASPTTRSTPPTWRRTWPATSAM